MRDNWRRATEVLDLRKKELEVLISPAFPNATIEEISSTAGGLANTNIRVKIAEHADTYLIRIYIRDPQAAKKEFALNRLIEKTVPSPRFIYFAETNSVTGHPYALMQWVDGQRLESVFSRLNERELDEVGKSIGNTLAVIHAFKFSCAGFFDGELAITSPIDLGSAGLIQFITRCFSSEIARRRAGGALADRLLNFVTNEAALLNK